VKISNRPDDPLGFGLVVGKDTLLLQVADAFEREWMEEDAKPEVKDTGLIAAAQRSVAQSEKCYRSESSQRNGEDFFNRSLQSAARKGLAAFVDPLQFCQKQLLQRFVHQVAESAERPAEFSEMTVRDQLQARPLLWRCNVSFALGLLDQFV
jgi:hypothetical protein